MKKEKIFFEKEYGRMKKEYGKMEKEKISVCYK